MGSFLLAFADWHAHTHIHSHLFPLNSPRLLEIQKHTGWLSGLLSVSIIRGISEGYHTVPAKKRKEKKEMCLSTVLDLATIQITDLDKYHHSPIWNCWDQKIQEHSIVILYLLKVCFYIFTVVIEDKVSVRPAHAVSVPGFKTQGKRAWHWCMISFWVLSE